MRLFGMVVLVAAGALGGCLPRSPALAPAPAEEAVVVAVEPAGEIGAGPVAATVGRGEVSAEDFGVVDRIIRVVITALVIFAIAFIGYRAIAGS